MALNTRIVVFWDVTLCSLVQYKLLVFSVFMLFRPIPRIFVYYWINLILY